MRIGIQLILLIGKPQPTIGVKDLFTQVRKELFEDASSVDAGSVESEALAQVLSEEPRFGGGPDRRVKMWERARANASAEERKRKRENTHSSLPN
jgi:hypothetical protein